MNITELKNSLPYLFKAKLTPFIWGHAGIGKTTVVRDVAKSFGYKFFALYLGTQADPGDVLGLQDFVKDDTGRSVATDFAIPLYLKEIIDYCVVNPDSGAVLFLDEFNRARKDILQGMFSLALDGKFHTMQLPPNCYLVAAGNPPTEEYMTTDVDETALMSRFVHIKLEPSFNEFIDYAKTQKFEPTLISFLQEQPELVSDHRSAFNLPVKVDNRSYERASRLFKAETPTDLLYLLLHGILGIERTVQYAQHLKNLEKPLTAREVLDGMKKDLLKVWATPGNIVASCISITCDNITSHFKEELKSKTLTDLESANVVDFFEAIPKDQAFKCMANIHALDCAAGKGLFNNALYQSRCVAILKEAKGIKDEGETVVAA